jgi:adenine/guanine phosphoribosyltransferase-like PRPP-binding protein
VMRLLSSLPRDDCAFGATRGRRCSSVPICLVIGAKASGLAFADALATEADVEVAVIRLDSSTSPSG